MDNAFDQFDTSQTTGTSANPFDQFTPPSQKQTSEPPQTTDQGLGFYKGITTAADNAARGLHWAADQVTIPFTRPLSDPTQKGVTLAGVIDSLGQHAGLPDVDTAVQKHHDYIAEQQAKGIQPGGWGEFAGDVVGTLPTLANPATKIGALMGGAEIGALLSDSDDPQTILKNIAIGAPTGLLSHVGMNALANRVAKPLVKTVGEWLTPAAERAPIIDPAEQGGADYVSRLMQAANKSPQDLTTAATLVGGKPLTAAEAIGPNGISAVTALARRQGTTGENALAQLSERASGMRDRILDDYAAQAGVHPDAAQGAIDDLVAAGRKSVEPMFKQALSVPGPVWSGTLQTLSKRPVIQTAINQAKTDLLNADIHPGVMGLASGPDEGKLLPTAEAWDLIRKNVAGQVERDPFGKPIPDSISRGNYNVNQSLRDLTAELKKTVPGYGDALDASGDYLSMQKAFENGKKYILSPTLTADKFATQFAKLSDPEKEAFKGGTANALYNKAQSGQLFPSIFKRPILSDKLSTVLGPDNAQTFLKNMETEANMSKAGARMMPGTNSTTGEVVNEAAEQDKVGAVMDALHATKHAATGNALGFGLKMKDLAQKLGAFAKTPGMPIPVRDEAGKLLLMKPGDLATHLQKLYGTGDSPSVQRVMQFLSRLQAPAQIALPALAVQSASGGP